MAKGLESKDLRRLADKLESLQEENQAERAMMLTDDGDTVIVELLFTENRQEFLRINIKSLEIMARARF